MAYVTRGKKQYVLGEGESIVIDKGQVHSVENLQDFPLDFIEIQTGDYLGEDDIIRLEDIYGRVNQN